MKPFDMFALDLVYGDSGKGKSSLAVSAVEHYLKQGRKVRIYTADNYKVYQQVCSKDGVEFWDMRTRANPFETVARACDGYWPADPEDPKSPLVAPKSLIEYGLFIYEGLTVYSDLLMGNMTEGGLADRIARAAADPKLQKHGPGTRPGEDAYAFMDGGFAVGGNSRNDYGLTQGQMRQNVNRTGRLLVNKLWTAHECKATEDNKPIFAPQLAGKAASAAVQRWFDTTLHLDTLDSKAGLEYRIYLKEHIDPAIPGIPFKAVFRAPVGGKTPVPAYINWTNDPDAWTKFTELRNRILFPTIN